MFQSSAISELKVKCGVCSKVVTLNKVRSRSYFSKYPFFQFSVSWFAFANLMKGKTNVLFYFYIFLKKHYANCKTKSLTRKITDVFGSTSEEKERTRSEENEREKEQAVISDNSGIFIEEAKL